MLIQAAGQPAHIIYCCIIGSRAYGLSTDASDIDRRGIYLAPTELQWSLDGAPEQIENAERQECFWELEKFIRLGLNANPTILECLYSPLVEFETELGAELREERQRFLSTRLEQTFTGYARSQFERLGRRQSNGRPLRWKEAMHLLRVLLVGISVAEHGRLILDVGPWRDELLAVRRGERSWSEIDAMRLVLERRFEEAFADVDLPSEPDIAWANAFLIRARRWMAEHDGA